MRKPEIANVNVARKLPSAALRATKARALAAFHTHTNQIEFAPQLSPWSCRKRPPSTEARTTSTTRDSTMLLVNLRKKRKNKLRLHPATFWSLRIAMSAIAAPTRLGPESSSLMCNSSRRPRLTTERYGESHVKKECEHVRC